MMLFPELERTGAAIAALKAHEPGGGYYGCFSGGKDSCVIKELAKMAGANVTWHYSQTTIDPPELVRFIRTAHPDVIWDRPKVGNFFHRLPDRVPPTRTMRWCCREYKETSPAPGAVCILGVRRAESPKRAERWRTVNFHDRARTWSVCPILNWSDDEVWHFIRSRGIAYCALYDEGWQRLGCIGCPMSDNREREFARWPGFERAWRRAITRWWERNQGTEKALARFSTPNDLWRWWMGHRVADTPLFDDDAESESCQAAIDMLSGGSE